MQQLLFYLCILVFCAASDVDAAAQLQGKIYRVGVLAMSADGPGGKALHEGLASELAQRGFVLGRNLAIETRGADNKPERLPGLAKELVESQVDVIVTASYPAARAAKEATATIPIVILNAGDPVETSLAASLSRPGGNLTGISDMSPELSVKRLDLLKEAVPGLKRVAMLWDAGDLGMATKYHAAAATAATLGIAVQSLGVREPDDFDAAFITMSGDAPDGLLMVSSMLTRLNHRRVFQFVAKQRIPAIYEAEGLVRDGGLMSYGPAAKEVVGRAVDLVARILKGAKPAELPFEQPTRFRFVINKKTAEALGLRIPEPVLTRADEVIE
jgi:ABC-type uncharacterized transport system substrate-binding protein